MTADEIQRKSFAQLNAIRRLIAMRKTCNQIILAALVVLCLTPAAESKSEKINPAASADPYVDELMTNGVESQSPFWAEIKEQLTDGNVDQAIKLCRRVAARRELDIDMHCMYAMALEMKYRRSEHDPAVFDECVKEWTHVAKVKILADSKGWEHIGDGEVFTQNQERKQMANRHLEGLVGRAPKYFESEKAFVDKAMKVNTAVAGKIKEAPKQVY